MPRIYKKSWDVFVVGGGPAGLATAIAARRHGLSVVVADGAIPPIDKSCGEGLMPDGVKALEVLDISIPERQGYPFRGIRFLNDGAVAEAAFPRGMACGIRRTHLHSAMVEHAVACGVRTLWQAAVTGLHPEGVMVAGEPVRARWVVGADGTSSRVRQWAKLNPPELRAEKNTEENNEKINEKNKKLRFAFRRHYRVAPWTDCMELHWGAECQVYVTPVSKEEVCVALISYDSKLRLEKALTEFPQLCSHLDKAEYTSTERGAITVTRRLRRVYRGRTALIGDASGGVDAITGEGLCLTFRQAALLGECLATRDLARYQRGHQALGRRPALMSHLMLFMAKHPHLRRRAMQMFEANPAAFAGMLALHVGEGSTRSHLSRGLAMGWQLLRA